VVLAIISHVKIVVVDDDDDDTCTSQYKDYQV